MKADKKLKVTIPHHVQDASLLDRVLTQWTQTRSDRHIQETYQNIEENNEWIVSLLGRVEFFISMS